MGSYNATCSATNMTIGEGDRVVCFVVIPITTPDGRTRAGFDCIASPYVVASFPMRGIYNDYGQFLGDDERLWGNDDDEIMLFHEFAYDKMVEGTQKEEAREKAFLDEYYADKPEPEYIVHRREEVEAALSYVENPPTDPDDIRTIMRASGWKRDLFGAPEGESYHMVYWGAALENCKEKSEDVRAFYERYKAEIRWLFGACFMYNFRIRPTFYGSQDTWDEQQTDLAKAAYEFRHKKVEQQQADDAAWEAEWAAKQEAEKTDADD